MATIDSNMIRKHRSKLGLNQEQFWSKLGVTQSGGSRYESGRNIPTPVQRLFFLVYDANVLAAIPGPAARKFHALGK